MTYNDALPEQSTTKLERAQWDYDRAFLLLQNETADAASRMRQREIALNDARDKLEQARRESAAAVPVDRSALQLSGGGSVTEDHREINPTTGQQKGYVVLSDAERLKGFVRPLRDAYRHTKCGKITTMSQDIAATYARDPTFYDGTFCTTCRAHFPVGEDGEFTWYENDGSEGPKVGT